VLTRRFGSAAPYVAYGLTPAVARLLADGRYDIVHVTSDEALQAVALRRAVACPLVISPDVSFRRLLRGPYGLAMRSALMRSAGVVCPSVAEQEHLTDLVPSMTDRVVVVPAGVDVAAIRSATPIHCTGVVMLSVGRLERHNGLEQAIAALAVLPSQFELAVIGEGRARRALRRFAVDLQVESRVHFLGPRAADEVYGWLRASRVVIAFSSHEASGLAVLQGAAAGTPTVASDVAVHREAASHAQCVTLLPVESSPLAIADAVADAARFRLQPLIDSIPEVHEASERTVKVYEAIMNGHAGASASVSAPDAGLSQAL